MHKQDFPSSHNNIVSAVKDGGSYSISWWLWNVVCDKLWNAQSIAPIEIHRQHASCYFPLLVAQYCHRAPVFQKTMCQMGAKAMDTRTQKPSAWLTIMVHLFLHLKKFMSGQRQRLQNGSEAETNVTQWFQSQAADFYETGIQKLIPWYDKFLNSTGEYVEK